MCGWFPAEIVDANLSGADLTGAYLVRANLLNADLTGTLMPDSTVHP